MKTTTKVLTFAFLFATSLLAFNANAQDMPMNNSMSNSMTNGMGFKIGFGAGAGITEGNSPFSYALGADLRLQWDLSPFVALTASGGYTRLIERENSAVPSYDFIPAVGSVKVFPIKRMYLSGSLGAGFAIKDGSKTSLIFGGGTGYEFNNGFELGIRYEGYQQDATSTTYQPITGQYAVRLGYNFKL